MASWSEPVRAQYNTLETAWLGWLGEPDRDGVTRASRLDYVLNNADRGSWVASVLMRGANAEWFESHYCLKREGLTGEVQTLPLSVVTRSWWTEAGRENIRRSLRARCAQLAGIAGSATERAKLITLTYRDCAESWTDTGSLRGFLDALRTHLRREGYHLSYFWVAEVQQRGALHYHIALVGAPYLTKSWLQGLWGRGFVEVRAVADVRGAVGYLMKYISKATAYDLGEVIGLQVMCAGTGHRRYGSSRDVSQHGKAAPQWAVEVAEFVGLELGKLEWRCAGRVGMVSDGHQTVAVRLDGLKWQVAWGAYVDEGEP